MPRPAGTALPNALAQPGTPGDPLPAAVLDPIWLEPLPDSALDSLSAGPGADPEAAYEARESVTLDFLALLQQLKKARPKARQPIAAKRTVRSLMEPTAGRT